MILFSTFIVAMFITMVLIPPLIHYAPALKLIDRPNARKVHKQAIPRVGGIAIVVGSMLPALALVPISLQFASYLLGTLVILWFGVWDDRRNLNYKYKIFGQTAAAGLVMLGGIKVYWLPFSASPLPEYLAIPFTLLALVGITNAFNLVDGLDGLAGGANILSFGILAILAFTLGYFFITLIAVAMMGSLLGFLRFNTHPAAIFMGDGGSQYLGFSVGVLTIILTQNSADSLSPAIALLILGMPILDTFMVMGRRLKAGRSPFAPDKNHIHHKLMQMGLSHLGAVAVIYAWQALLIFFAYVFRDASDEFLVALYLLFCLLVITLLFQNPIDVQRLSRWFSAQPLSEALVTHKIARLAFYAVVLFLLAYATLACLVKNTGGLDISLLAGALWLLLLGLAVRHRGRTVSWVEQGGIYVTCAMLVYVVEMPDQQFSGWAMDWTRYHNWFFISLVALVFIGLNFSASKRFKLNTLDMLIIFVAVVVPNLSFLSDEAHALAQSLVRMLVLFYAAEFLMSNLIKRWDLLRLALLTFLSAFTLKNFVA